MQHMVTTVFPSSSLYYCSLIHYIHRSRSIHISIHRNTIRSITPLVFQFLVTLGTAMTNVIVLISVFKLKRQDST